MRREQHGINHLPALTDPPLEPQEHEDQGSLGKRLTLSRLRGVYDLAATLLVPDPEPSALTDAANGGESAQETPRKKLRLLDVGTHNGFAVSRLTQIADYVLSFDLDEKRIAAAKGRRELQTAQANGSLELYVMNALDMDRNLVQPGSFQRGTAIEVLNSKYFDNHHDQILGVLKELSDALEEGGLALFTISSLRADDFLKMMQWNLRRGAPMSHTKLEEELIQRGLFKEITWYGQVILKVGVDGVEGSHTIPPFILNGNIVTETFKPRPVGEHEVPIFWIALARK